MRGALRKYAEGGEVQQALSSKDVNGALMQMLLGRVQQRPPEESPETQAAYQSMQQQLTQPVDESSKWWQMASGLMAPTRTGSFTEATGVGAGKYGDALAVEEKAGAANRAMNAQLGVQRQTGLDKTRQANYAKDLGELSDLAQRQAALAGRGSGGKFIQFADDQGNRYIMNNATGEREVIAATKNPLWTKVYLAAKAQAVKERMEDPEGYATATADASVANSPRGTTSNDAVQKPAVLIDGSAGAVQTPTGVDKPSFDFAGMTPHQVRLQLKTVPDGPDKQAILEHLDQQPKDSRVQPQPQTKPRSMEYLDPRTEERNKKYGTEEGKALSDERQNMAKLHGANLRQGQMLNQLEEVYSRGDIPEGELGPVLQALRSGAKSMGIPVNENVGLADMAKAWATGMALESRTAGDHNLLPGAMSNYEDKLLQSMVPGLSTTQQGRMGMIKMMKAMNDANLRISGEATKMASANKDMLPTSWEKRKERVMLEEMVRLKDISARIIKEHGGK